jgi:predicted nuclease of predicted toxin-antitoxin system
MRMMLDENISPSLVTKLWGLGIDTTAVHHRDLLAATDYTVWTRAQSEERALVTINESDFEKLARKSKRHHGLISIPGGGTREKQFEYVSAASLWARSKSAILPNFKDTFVVVDQNGLIKAERLVSENDNISFLRQSPAAS